MHAKSLNVSSLVSPGGRCSSGLERCLGGSTCSGGVCTCPFGTVVRLGECQPIQQVVPGSPCDNELLRCTGLSVCVFNRCECPSGMTIQGGTCRISPTVIAGSSCASGERCGGNSMCINSVCTCPINTINQNGICRSPVSGAFLSCNLCIKRIASLVATPFSTPSVIVRQSRSVQRRKQLYQLRLSMPARHTDFWRSVCRIIGFACAWR